MVHKIMLLLSVVIPFVSSLSFNFPSFNKSTPTLLNLEGDAFWNHVIQLTKNEVDSSGPTVGAAVYPQPLLLWDSANLTDFTTHFSFRIVANTTARLRSGLSFFLSPYPYSPPDADSQNPIVAIEFGASRNKADPSNCRVGFEINSVEPDPYINCNDDITRGRTSSATVSYSSSARSLAVLVTYDVDEGDPGSVGTLSLSHEVDLRDVLPGEVAVGFSAAAADSSAELHEIMSWNFSSTLQAPASAPSPAQGATASAAGGKIRMLTGLVGGSLGAAVVGVGTVCSILWYKMSKLSKHVKDGGSIKSQVRVTPSLGDVSLFLDDDSTPVEAVAGLTEQAASRLQATRGAKRSERVLRKGMFNWLYGKLFKSENLGCL